MRLIIILFFHKQVIIVGMKPFLLKRKPSPKKQKIRFRKYYSFLSTMPDCGHFANAYVHTGLEHAAHANSKRSLILIQVPVSACFALNLQQWCLVAAEHVCTGSFGTASKGVGWFSWVLQCIRVRAYAPFLLFWDPHFVFGLNDCEVHKPS